MCTACESALFFAPLGGAKPSRRPVFRAAAIAATAGAVAACSVPESPSKVSAEPVGSNGYADFIFHNGPIYTVAGPILWGKALAVKGNAITYAGDEDGAMAAAAALPTRSRLDQKVGSLAVGKLADLIVLDKNIFDLDVREIHSAAVELTMMSGQVRHQK